MSESDGVDEAVGGGIRIAVTAAGLVAERMAQARAERAKAAEAVSEKEARRLEARLGVEGATARAQLSQVDRDGWWDNAGVSEVADAWETAQAWRRLDPLAERAAERIEREVRLRYGVDVHDSEGLDPATLERAAVEREAAGVDRRRARQAGEELEAAVLLAATEPHAVTQEQEAPPQAPRWWTRDPAEYGPWSEQVARNEKLGYSSGVAKSLAFEDLDRTAQEPQTSVGARDAAGIDTAPEQVGKSDDLAHQVVAGIRVNAERDVTGRRADLAKALGGVGDHEAVEARLLADVSAGRPAWQAVTASAHKSPKARKERGAPSPVRQRGLGR